MYTLGNKKYINKDDIKAFVKSILETNYVTPGPNDVQKPWHPQKIFNDDHIEILTELATYHEDKHKKDDIFAVAVKKTNAGYNLMIDKSKFPNRYYPQWQPVSINKCIDNIKTDRSDVYYFSFGKYAGKYIDEINDDRYLSWILLESDLPQVIKDNVYNFLKTKQ
jgi:hypothetical protein